MSCAKCCPRSLYLFAKVHAAPFTARPCPLRRCQIIHKGLLHGLAPSLRSPVHPLSCSRCTFARRRQKRLLALGFGRSKGVKPVTVSSSLLVGGTISERLTRYARGPLSMLTMHQPCPSLLKSTGLDRTWSRDPCPKCKGPAIGIPIGTGSVIRQRGAMHG